MKFLFCSDSFKGTLSSDECGSMLLCAAEQVFGAVDCKCLPVADGGEGTITAIIEARGGSLVNIKVHNPLMEEIQACYGRLDEHRVIMEMSQASGLTLISQDRRNPLNTTSYGTGEMILDALNNGYTDISIAIGGSATNDGGMGCMKALGVKFLDKDGNELSGCGKDLIKVAHIDTKGLDPRLSECLFTIMCDVTNPLCGKDGATYTFGKQKGGTPESLDYLEKGMCNFRDVIKKDLGVDCDNIEGAGAAGGLGAALMVFLKGYMKRGIETVLSLIEFDKHLEGVDLVVTGEGRTDWQSCFGKVIQGVGDHCKSHNIPCVCLVGSMGERANDILSHGIRAILPTVTDTIPLEVALKNAKKAYIEGAIRLFSLIKLGMDLKK